MRVTYVHHGPVIIYGCPKREALLIIEHEADREMKERERLREMRTRRAKTSLRAWDTWPNCVICSLGTRPTTR